MPKNSQQDSIYRISVSEHFNSLASQYDGSAEWRQNPEIISWFMRYLGKNNRCLDLATGTGIIGGQLKTLGSFVVGVDYSYEMLQAAQDTLIDVVCADALNLPFSRASFDAVSVRQLFHYVDDQACLGEIARVTSPGGLLACAHISAPNLKIAQWWRKIKSMVQPLRLRFYTSHELRALVRASGFSIKRTDTIVLTRSDSWEKFFINCTSTDDISAVHQMLENTPDEIKQQIDLQLTSEGVSYTQYWTLILGRRE